MEKNFKDYQKFISRWDAKKWNDDFHSSDNFYERAELRSIVFKSTVNTAIGGSFISAGGKETDLDDYADMVKNSRYYCREFDMSRKPTLEEGTTKVMVENKDCILAAKELQEKGYKTAVLNMANRQNPGGGVVNGAGAQEENIFRRSNLFLSLFQFAEYAQSYGLPKSKYQYPMDRNYGGIFTPDATVFRDTEDNGYAFLDEPFRTSFITVAGMNNPKLTKEGLIAPELVEPVKNKIRTIFRLGLDNGIEAIVLGALGCGAFCNPPAHVARLFHEVMEEDEFRNKFKVLYFAILEDANSHQKHNPNGNFEPFAKEFAK